MICNGRLVYPLRDYASPLMMSDETPWRFQANFSDGTCQQRHLDPIKSSIASPGSYRRVQWSNIHSVDGSPGRRQPIQMTDEEEELETTGLFNRKHATTQWDETVVPEARGRNSAATQWSDQEPPMTFTTGTQWSPIDIFTMKTIPGYTGHLPGRHFVTPGKTYRQEMESVLTHFQPKSSGVTPITRHTLPVQQQRQDNDLKGEEDPYFDKRPPSTYTRNYNPIPGYQGFVPRVRTSTSSLGIRYIKAVEKSLEAIHAHQNEKAQRGGCGNVFQPEDIGTSPKKLLDQRPLHTPRHRPHPHHTQDEDEDWRATYNRPPSTYLSTSRTYIPGYKGFVPHLRDSTNAIGVRYSKAALMCLEASESEKLPRPRTFPMNKNIPTKEEIKQVNLPEPEDDDENNHKETTNREEKPNDPKVEFAETHQEHHAAENTHRHLSDANSDRPYRQDHAYYLNDRRPSTYKTEKRHPIPGYQGFIPRMRDSPSTLGLRYTKAAIKTLEDLHRMQIRDAAAAR